MRNLLLVISLLTLSACATSVNVDFDPKTNFATIKSFQVQAKPVNVIDHPRIDSPFMQQRTIKAIGDSLTLKGMTFTKSEPDVIVKYHIGINKELESDESGVSFGFGTFSRHSAIGLDYGFPEVATVENLVITIDMVASSTNLLLWRGSLARRLYEGSTPASNTKLVNKMVAEILNQFPLK